MSASWDTTIRLWDVDKGTNIRTFKGHTKGIMNIVFSGDGKTIASTSVDDGIVYLWDATPIK